jgi:hypothetical protein
LAWIIILWSGYGNIIVHQSSAGFHFPGDRAPSASILLKNKARPSKAGRIMNIRSEQRAPQSTFKRVEMTVAIRFRIALLQFRIYHALTDHLLGNFFVIRPCFFLSLARHADGFMVIARQNPLILLTQTGMAPRTFRRTVELLFPILRHFSILLSLAAE